MTIKINKKTIILELIFLIILIQQAVLLTLSGNIKSIVSYFDEIVSMLFILSISYNLKRTPVTLLKEEKDIAICFSSFIIIGLLSNIANPMQNIFLNVSDALVCSRFIIFYFFTRLCCSYRISRILISKLCAICKIFTILIGVLSVIQVFIYPIFPIGEYRYFMNSIILFYPHQTYLAVACMTCIATFIIDMGANVETKNGIYIIIRSIVMALTIRMKAIVSVIIIFFFWFCWIKNNIKSDKFLLGCGALVAGVIGYDQFSFYYFTNSTTFVRARLHVDAFKLANRFFPLGTGFATFGSSIAATHYSQLYIMLGYGSLHGGGRGDGAFLSDTFWPIVLAQTGWLGFVFFGIVVYKFVKIALDIKENNTILSWGVLSIMVYELISSTSEPAFFNPPVCLLFIVFGLAVNISVGKDENNGKKT